MVGHRARAWALPVLLKELWSGQSGLEQRSESSSRVEVEPALGCLAPGFCLAFAVASHWRPGLRSLATAAPPSRRWFLPHCACAASPSVLLAGLRVQPLWEEWGDR